MTEEDIYDVETPVTVRFEADKDDLEKILKAERLLREAGIEFDTGMPIDSSPRAIREWHFDGIGGKAYGVESKTGYTLTKEELAGFAHQLWMHWSQHIAEEEPISESRLDRWDKLWAEYENLSEEMKDKDRDLVDKFLG